MMYSIFIFLADALIVFVMLGAPAYFVYWCVYGKKYYLLPRKHVVEVNGEPYEYESRLKSYHDMLFDVGDNHLGKDMPLPERDGLGLNPVCIDGRSW